MIRSEKVELVRYRIERAKETLTEVEFQIQNEKWATAVNRLYYACYYAVIALLAWNDINAKTHSGVRQMFGLNFIKPGIIEERHGDFYTDIFETRQTGDYDDYIVIEEDKVKALFEPASELISEIERILTKSGFK